MADVELDHVMGRIGQKITKEGRIDQPGCVGVPSGPPL